MKKFIILFALITTSLYANEETSQPINIHHGIMTGLMGGMTNTLKDNGQSPDAGTFGGYINYMVSFKKTPESRFYSYLKLGVDYELGFVEKTPLQGLGISLDSGSILFNYWRIGAGVEFNYLTKKSIVEGIINGFILNPYLETSAMVPIWDNHGFDFGFRMGIPVRLAGQSIEPYYSIKTVDMIDWKVMISYFYFF